MRSPRIGEAVFRRVLLFAILFVLQRYLAPLVPLWIIAGWYLSAMLFASLSYRRDRRLVVQAAITGTGVVLSAIGIALTAGIIAVVGLDDQSHRIEAVIALLPYTVLIPSLLVIPFALLDIAARNNDRVAGTVGPLAIVSVVPLFWSQGMYRTALFPHSIWYLGFAFFVSVCVIGYQRTFSRRTGRVERRSGHRLVPILLVGSFLLSVGLGYRMWSSGATAVAGGLMRPDLFHFDFSDFIRLESKITMGRDLVLLYREDGMPPDRLIRRFVLDGYDARRGFYRIESESDAPSDVPRGSDGARDAAASVEPDGAVEADTARTVTQEYYLINLSPDAILTVPRAVGITALPQWDNSSFSRAYRVSSYRPQNDETLLMDIQWPTGPDATADRGVGTPQVPTRIATLARDITAGETGMYESIRAIETYLREEYYYSLNPGVAVDGDQLDHFLFTSQKGYCSYFAFSMALMVRSLGVPARVAVGFFVDPSTSMIGFYPIRADMAHAWVEVWFPGIGWVEFDPTSQQIAPGEDVAFDLGIDYDRLSSLVEEILHNESIPQMDMPGTRQTVTSATGIPRRRVLRLTLAAIILFWVVAVYLLRLKLCRVITRTPRDAVELLYRRSKRLARREARLGISRWSESQSPGPRSSRPQPPQKAYPPVGAIGHYVDCARYAATFSPEEARSAYTAFREAFGRLPPGGETGSRFAERVLGVLRRIGWFVVVRLPSRFPGRCNGSTRLIAGSSPRSLVLWFVWLAAANLPYSIDAQTLLEPETSRSADELLLRIDEAIDLENYSIALDRIVTGRQQFPDDFRFSRRAGDLYFRERLFDPARRAWEDALEAGAPAYPVQYDISRAYSRLNRNEPAIDILAQLTDVVPEDLLVVDDLAWLYYKENRLEDAKTAIQSALSEYGPDRNLSMTLGTVYAGQFLYDDAVNAYETAIADARQSDDRYFMAVAYYNLSIVHARFYRWQEASTSADRSMEMIERSSGYMIRAELERMRLQLGRAVDSLERAVTLEENGTLASLALASTYIEIGQPDRAIAIIEDLMDREHDGWLYYYGTDPDRYLQQLYGVASDAWEAGANRDSVHRTGSFFERMRIAIRGARRRVLQWFYTGMYRRQSVRVAEHFDSGGRPILAAWHRMQSSGWMRPIALRYLDEAERLELPVNPAAASDYRLVRADVTGDSELFLQLAADLSGAWQRAQRLEALLGAYETGQRRDKSVVDAAADAWVLHPDSFFTRGLKIPMEVEATAPARRILRRLGIDDRSGSPLVLRIRIDGDEILWAVRDRRANADLRRGRTVITEGLAAALEAVVDQITTIN